MGKNKKIKIQAIQISAIIFCVFVLLLGGINGCPKEGKPEVATEGLVASFVENAPPLSVTVNEQFKIYVTIRNAGGSFINDRAVKLYLIVPGDFEGIPTKKAENKKSYFCSSAFRQALLLSDKAFSISWLLSRCFPI